MAEQHRIVEVEWEDTASTHGWQHKEDLPETWICHSIGYVDRDDDAGLRLIESRASHPTAGKARSRDYGCANMIPRSAIRKVTELRRKGDKRA